MERRNIHAKIALFSFVLVLSALYLPMATPVAAQVQQVAAETLQFAKAE
jgi:hypothetical protein